METAELLVRLISESAQRLQTMAAERGLLQVNERDHLDRCFRKVLADTLPRTGYRPASSGERKCNFPVHFPRVGDVDALLVPDTGAPVWVELKCSADPKWALADCGWDAVKSAVAVAHGAASEAYLLAGAPATRWQARVLGAQLFAHATWSAEHVRAAFEALFRRYEKLADPRPALVPATFATEAVGPPAPFSVNATLWELRLARVTARNDDWYEWPPFLTTEQQDAALQRRAQRR